MDFPDVLLEQSIRYPLMGSPDWIKLVYQSAFGAEHLFADLDSVERYFHAEFSGTKPARSVPLLEDLGGDLLRVNFAPYKAAGFSEADLFELFVRSALPSSGKEARFAQDIAILEAFLGKTKGSPARAAFEKDYAAYREQGLHPLHHSEIYRKAYDPHYRLVSQDEWALFLNRL
jgi:hypothetical protein